MPEYGHREGQGVSTSDAEQIVVPDQTNLELFRFLTWEWNSIISWHSCERV